MCVSPAIYQKMDTSVGLSTIASLSLGLSMSMTGSGRAVICRNLGAALPIPIPTRSPGAAQRNAADESKLPSLPELPRSTGVGGALQAGFAGPQRRTSFVGILHQMSAQNRLLFSQQETSAASRRLSTSDVQMDATAESTTEDPRRRSSDGASRVSVDIIDDTSANTRIITGETTRT